MTTIPDTLVKLANLGSAGVCVLVIFLLAYIIIRHRDGVPKATARLVYAFMVVCLIIAAISASLSYALASNSEATIRDIGKEAVELKADLEASKKDLENIQKQIESLKTKTGADALKAAQNIENTVEKAAEDTGKSIQKAGTWINKRFGF